MKSNNLIALALSIVPALAIPPEDFGFPTSEADTPLSVTYGSNTEQSTTVEPGILFGIDVPAEQPTIAINTTYPALSDGYNGDYFLLMVDPDASYPENPVNRFIIHWWQEGLQKAATGPKPTTTGGTVLVNSTAPKVSYRRPRPPTNSSAHRYIQYLFEQPANFQIPDIYSGYGGSNITKFPLEQFLSDVGLVQPVAANYFYCSNQTAVPHLFVGEAGGEYPGGNGAMITQGTNEPTPTAASSSASMTGTATGTASPSMSAFAGAGSAFTKGDMLAGILVAVGLSWALL